MMYIVLDFHMNLFRSEHGVATGIDFIHTSSFAVSLILLNLYIQGFQFM